MGYLPSLSTVFQFFGGVIVLGLASTAGLLYRYQRTLIYPSSFPQGSRTEVLSPSEFGIPFTEEHLNTPDGETLRAFVMLQQAPSEKEIEKGATLNDEPSTTARRRPTIIFLHANAGNMGHRLPLASVFYKRFGCNVLMLSYRGYGLSSGQPSERGIRIDAQTALDWIRNHPVLKETLLVTYGQSIGGAVAIDLAARNPKRIHALILENTFLSIPELIPHVLPPVRPFAFLCREYWPSSVSIGRISPKTPVLFLSGRQDELVPPSHMDALFERCTSEKKVWNSFADGTHNDTCVKPGYFDAISSFLLTHIVSQLQGSSTNPTASLGSAPSERFAELGSTSPAPRAASTARSSSKQSTAAKRTSLTGSASGGGSAAGASAPASADGEDDGEWVEMDETDVSEGQAELQRQQQNEQARAGGAGGVAPSRLGEALERTAGEAENQHS